MKTVLVGVLSTELPDVFMQVQPFLEEMANSSSGKYHPGDIAKAIADRNFQLWVAVDPESKVLRAAAVTEIVNFPRKRVCRVLGATGDDFEMWVDHILTMERWSKASGCTSMEPFTRPGWERVLKKHGYRKSHVLLEKEI